MSLLKRVVIVLALAVSACNVSIPPQHPAPARAYAVDVFGPVGATIALDGANVPLNCGVPQPMQRIRPASSGGPELNASGRAFLHIDCPALPSSVTALNVHLTLAPGYNDYNCVAQVPAGNATLLIGNGPVEGNRYQDAAWRRTVFLEM